MEDKFSQELNQFLSKRREQDKEAEALEYAMKYVSDAIMPMMLKNMIYGQPVNQGDILDVARRLENDRKLNDAMLVLSESKGLQSFMEQCLRRQTAMPPELVDKMNEAANSWKDHLAKYREGQESNHGQVSDSVSGVPDDITVEYNAASAEEDEEDVQQEEDGSDERSQQR